MLNFLKKKTYLPKLKLMDRSTENKNILKDDLSSPEHEVLKGVRLAAFVIGLCL